jgi:sporulation protein YlmC with PRC-barrel domain
MKNHRVILTSFASAVVLAGALAAWAQQVDQNNQRNQNNQASQSDQANQNSTSSDSGTAAGRDLGKLDDKTKGATIRASQLMGQNIKNSNGDNVGEIKDLVIDPSGKVRYAAVTYGGFLGLGSKLFAVPFEAFHVSHDPNDRNSRSGASDRNDRSDRNNYVLTLDVTKDQLKGAQGFDNDRWPDFADTNFTQELHRRYNVDRSQNNSQAERDQNRNQSR